MLSQAEFSRRSTPWAIMQIQDSIPPRLVGNIVVKVFLSMCFGRSFNKILNGIERHKTRNFCMTRSPLLVRKSAVLLPETPQWAGTH
ncbi:hypothetical protein TNCV_326551 [Trichonephila clavipes]|nr:hypothetical protein TNCV_326551 [Trichonephila clavipes]